MKCKFRANFFWQSVSLCRAAMRFICRNFGCFGSFPAALNDNLSDAKTATPLINGMAGVID